VDMPVAVEGCDGLLRHRPIARRGIQVRVDRTRLDVVDRDAPASYLEPIMMMRPPLFMCFSAACVATSAPRTLMSITRSSSSSVVSSNVFGMAVPALFTRTSSRPNVLTAFATEPRTASASAASAWIASAFPPPTADARSARHRIDSGGSSFSRSRPPGAFAGRCSDRGCTPDRPSREALLRHGFLTGHELTWMPEALRILRDELPNVDVMISSQYSPVLADGLSKGKLDAAFLRRERGLPNLAFRLLVKERLTVILPTDHRLAALKAIRPQDLAGETFVNVSNTAPVLRAVIDDYLKRS